MSNGRPWTAEDRSRLRRLVAHGMTDTQIGEALNRDGDLIGRKRRELKIAPGQPAGLRAMMARINYRRMARA